MLVTRSCFKHRAFTTVALLILLVISGLAQANGATLTTDKLDYAPGETVVITGTGFSPNEPIDQSIAIEDPNTGLWVPDWERVEGYADEQGGFTAYYLVPEIALGMNLRATAIGLTSGTVASVAFTDGYPTHNIRFATNGLPNGIAITVDWNKINIDGKPRSGSTTIISPTPSSYQGTKPGTVFTYSQFPAFIIFNRETYDFISVTPASGFTTGVDGGTTVITATYKKHQTIPCPKNTAPSITASNLYLGDFAGCLVEGSFQSRASVAPESFNPIASDPEGDPVTVTSSVSEVTFVGPGVTDVVVTLTATDDPTARNVEGYPSLIPLSTRIDVHVTARIVYTFTGFVSPLPSELLGSSTVRVVKQGVVIPVKFQLFDSSGVEITDMNLPAEGYPVIDVAFQQTGVLYEEPTITAAGNSNNDSSFFRYSAPDWIYNLKTNSSYTAGNTYRISVYLNDNTVHDAYISIKK